MEYRYWPWVMFVLVIPLPAQGHDACYDDGWKYHSHTHSCFHPYQTGKTWTEARHHCADVPLGRSYGAVTRLAKIDDINTNDFVRDTVFPKTTWTCWIGLHKINGEFRWDGYPDEIPKFNHSTWKNPSRPYVSMQYENWKGEDVRKKRHLVCQHEAKKIGSITCQQQSEADGLKFICTSAQSPIKAKCQWIHKYETESFESWTNITNPSLESHRDNTEAGGTSYTTTCSFTLSNLSPGTIEARIRMYPDVTGSDLTENQKARTVKKININVAKPLEATFIVSNKYINGPPTIVAQGAHTIITCTIDTGSPAVSSTTMACDASIAKEITTRDSLTPSSYSVAVGKVRGDMDGLNCTCWGNHVTGRTEDSTLTFKVITKPSKVSCQTDLHPERLLFSCHTDKIFPDALCSFSYRYEAEGTFNSVSNTSVIDYSHEPYTGSDDLLYYQSNCSVTLTPDIMFFSPGDFTVQVTVNPNIEGIDQDTSNDAFITIHKTVKIDLPNKPQFQRLGTMLNSSSPVDFVENDRMDLRCQVLSGNPSVYSVTLACDFPFNLSDTGNKNTVPGSAYVINEIASRDMNGKRCTCFGNHLAGATEPSSLTFNITYPSEVKYFKVNEKDAPLVEVAVDETLALSCEADGNPLPSVQVRKLGTSYLDTSTWQSDQSESKVEVSLVARCGDNGKYRCSVGNTENTQEEIRELDIRVRCPPTYCNESSRDIKMAVRPGRSEAVSLCVVAYPMPALMLWKQSKGGWNDLEDVDHIDQVPSSDFHQTVTINISVLNSSHLGEYALASSGSNGMTSLDLYFQLTAPLSHCNMEDSVDHKVTLGEPSTLYMCVAAFPSPTTLTLEMRIGNGSTWRSYTNPNVTVTMGLEVNILTNVSVVFLEVKAQDLGEYRLVDPQEATQSYFKFNLSELPTEKESRSNHQSGNSTVLVTSVVIAITCVVICVVIVSIFIVKRRRRYRDPLGENTSGCEDKTDDEKTDTRSPVYDNDGFVGAPGKEEDTERMQSNTANQNTTPDVTVSQVKTAADEDALVYIELEFVPRASNNTKPKSKKKSKLKRKPEEVEKKEEETTEYATISVKATIEKKMEREKKEEEERLKNEKEKDENEGRELSEEEAVYENVQIQDNVP